MKYFPSVWLSTRLYSTSLCLLSALHAVETGSKDNMIPNSFIWMKQQWLQFTSTLIEEDRFVISVYRIVCEWPILSSLCFVSASFSLYQLYRLLFVPLNRVRNLEDVGYANDPAVAKRDAANNIRRRRAIGNIPPVYPNGWFGLMECFDLVKNQVKEINALGLHLAVFRDEEGKAHVLDAYCPHLGANMAIGGKVKGKCLECPFHGWKFRGDDGKCMHIPAAEKVPDIAKVKSWPVMEVNGWIYLWYHAEGAEPYWKPPEMTEITEGTWSYRGRTEHIVNAQIQEIPENGSDVAHLAQVHRPFMAAGTDLRYMWSKLWKFVEHGWQASWEPFEAPNGHMAQMTVCHKLWLFGKHLSMLDMAVKAKQTGPGFVYLQFDCGVFGKGVIIHNLLPVGPLTQKLIHDIYVETRMPTFLAKFYMLAEAIQVERDIMIWNNKMFQSKPIFAKSKEDSTIQKYRRWYSQFYSENSPRLKFQNDTLDW